MSEVIMINHKPVLITNKTHIGCLQCADCGQILDALHMSDIDPTLCGECADKKVEKLQEDIPETTLVLWETSNE